MRLIYLLAAGILINSYNAAEEGNESDGDTSRKILGSSVVTSVSVVLDAGDGKKTVYTDAIGTPQLKPSNPSDLASPINLLNPDRYEFYTFDDNGDLIKRLMSLDEIKSIIATGDSDALDFDSFTSQGFLPEKRVSDVVNNVQSVLKEELEILKDPITKPIFDTPDVSDSWSMILPAVFGNSGHDIKPEKPTAHVTADTIMLEPNFPSTTPAPQKMDIILSSSSTIRNRPQTSSTHKPSSFSTYKPSSFSTSSPFVSQPIYYSSQSLVTTKKLPSTTEPIINVEIFSNSMTTTQKDSAKESTNSSLAVEEKQSEKEEPIPTRAPAVHVSKPPLVRNVTKNENKTTTLTSLTASTPLEYLTELYSQTDTESSETSGPTTIETTKISFRPTIEHIFPDTISTSKITSTSSKPSSINLTTSYSSTQGSSTISTSPASSTYKSSTYSNKNISATTSSTFNAPTHKGTAVGSSTSKLTINPQLGLSSTVSNDHSISSNKMGSLSDQTSTHLSSTVPVTVIKTTEPDLITEGSLSSISTFNLGHATSTSNNPSSWTPSIKDSELFNIFKETIAKGTTTGYIHDSKLVTATNNKDVTTEITATKEPGTTTENKNQSNDYNHLDDNDLSTLPTEYLGQNIIGNMNENNNDFTTKFPPLLHSLSDNQKLSASELLDQLLFTTNIYEINTELASPKLNATNTDVRFDNKEINQQSNPVDQEFDQQITTTDHDIISYPPTTDVTLIQSIEQLLSQAVGDIEIALNQTVNTTKLQGWPQGNKNMTDFVRESATMASEITLEHKTVEPIPENINTSEKSSVDIVSTIANSNDLSSSVDSSYENSATINKVRFTEKPDIGITYRRADDSSESPAFYKSSTQKYDPNSETSTKIKKETVSPKLPEKLVEKHTEAQQETTTYYYVIKKKVSSSNKSEPSNILNITVLSVEPNKNPAKADLSLEQEIIAEEMKNASLLLDNNFKSESSPNELIKLSETNVNELTLTNLGSSYINPTENSTENLDYFTTPYLNEYDTTTLSEQSQVTDDNPSTVADIETSTYSLLDIVTTELTTMKTVQKEEAIALPSTTTKKTRNPPKPSIVITVNENNTLVTENVKLVANKTKSTPLPLNSSVQNETLTKQTNTSTIQPIKFIEKNATQDQTWTLVPTVAPHLLSQNVPPPTISYQDVINPPVHVDLVPKPMQGFGLEESTANLDTDVFQFAQLCNELAFGFWKTVTAELSSARSIFVSPFAAISMLAMVFLGAKGATSEEMNEILKLDDMVTFNPHLIFKNVSESITDEPYSGVATTAMIRELFSDRSKGKLLDFYKNRVKAFYDGYVEEVGYREIGDVIRRRTNMLIKKYSNEKYSEFLRDSSITVRPPLSGVSINIFETDCSQTSFEGRDGELHFIVLPSIRQRRLVPIPAVVYRSGFLAGYEPSLDATAVSLGTKEQVVSVILVIPGQQGIAAPGDGLARLEKRLVESSFKKGAWARLLRSLIPRPGLEVQIPRFSHRSIINATNTLQKMGLHELFNPETADLRGLNGVANELHLSDVLQINSFMTCGEKRIDEAHHSELYPATSTRGRAAKYLYDIPTTGFDDEPRDYQRAFHDPLHDPSLLALPLPLRPRQARIPEIPRLRFDRPFLYFIRHNPTGLILHMGRFNPRLLP